MKQKFLLREIDGEYLLVPLGNSNQQFTSLITMNETGAFIWKRLEQNKTPEQIATDLSKEYQVSFDKAKTDVVKFIAYLRQKSVL